MARSPTSRTDLGVKVSAVTAATGGVAARPPLFVLRRALIYAGVAAIVCGGTARAEAPVRLAIALPLSGPQQALGRQIRIAIELTAAELTARGGPPLSFTWHDDQCSARGGLAVAQQIAAFEAGQRPALVIGHACPSAAEAAGPGYATAGIAHLVAGHVPSRAPNVRRFGLKHFRMQAAGDQGSAIGHALAALEPEKRVAFVRDRTLFAQSTLQAAAGVLAANHRAPALFETFAGGDKDFAALALRLRTAGVTHMVLAAFPSEASLLVSEVRKINPDLAIVATDTLADEAFARSAGNAADGVRVALAPTAEAFPAAAKFVRKLEAATGAPANRLALTSAAAVDVASAAAGRAKGEDLLSALADGTFESSLGSISFDAAGTARLPSYVFYTWRNGRLLPPSAVP